MNATPDSSRDRLRAPLFFVVTVPACPRRPRRHVSPGARACARRPRPGPRAACCAAAGPPALLRCGRPARRRARRLEQCRAAPGAGPADRPAQPKLQRQGPEALAAVQRPRCLHHVTRRPQRRLGAVAVRAHHEALSHRSLSGVAAAPWCAHLDIRLHHVVQSRQRPLHLDERCALHAGDLGSAGSDSLGSTPRAETRTQAPARHMQAVRTFASISLLAK